MFKKFVLAIVNFFLKERSVLFFVSFAIGWSALTAFILVCFSGEHTFISFICFVMDLSSSTRSDSVALTTLTLLGVLARERTLISIMFLLVSCGIVAGYIASLYIAVFMMRSLKNHFTFNEKDVVQVFNFQQFIWEKDYDALKPNIASYRETMETLSFECTDDEWDDVFIISILVSFGGTPEKMFEIVKKFGNDGILDEMKRRLMEGGVCNICKTNALSVVQGILGENVEVSHIGREQALYCPLDDMDDIHLDD